MSLIRALLLISMVSLASCSKERLFHMEKSSFVNTIPETLQKAPQVVTLNSDDDLPFITAGGNAIDFDITRLYRAGTGGSVSFPLQLEITELLSVKDIILHQKPTVSGNKLLTTDGQIKVQIFKDQNEVQLYPGALRIDMEGIFPTQGDPEMMIFLGEENGGRFNWRIDSSSCYVESGRLYCENISTGKTSDWDYILFPSHLGWINIDKFAEYRETTTLHCVAGQDNVFTFLYFPEIKSVLKIYDEKTDGIPVGMKAVVIALAFAEDGSPFSYFEEITIRENHTVTLQLTPTTQEKLLKRLEDL